MSATVFFALTKVLVLTKLCNMELLLPGNMCCLDFFLCSLLLLINIFSNFLRFFKFCSTHTIIFHQSIGPPQRAFLSSLLWYPYAQFIFKELHKELDHFTCVSICNYSAYWKFKCGLDRLNCSISEECYSKKLIFLYGNNYWLLRF